MFKAGNKDRYNAWRKKNLHRLIEAGIPHEIADDNRQFWFVVQEGEHLYGAGWNVSWITEEQAERLLALFTDYFGDCHVGDLIDCLQRKLGRPTRFSE